MITLSSLHEEKINSPVRSIKAEVELYNGSTLVDTYKHNDILQSITIERVGDNSKFFGFGICQKINVKIIDTNREISITTANSLKVKATALEDNSDNYVTISPLFYVTEVHRDENTNALSITAYDAIYSSTAHTVSEVTFQASGGGDTEIPTGYTIKEYVEACISLLGLKALKIINVADTETCFDTFYEFDANFDGTETIREALNAVSEVTQTIFYIDTENNLVFKRLDGSGDAVLEIDKSKYISLDSSTNRKLSIITHTTELRDDVTASITETGSTQYVRNNPFWELRDDIGSLLEAAIEAVGGLTINQFACEWRGNYALEIGDKIALTTKDNGTVYSYVLNDTISYDGALSENTEWSYTDNKEETSDNPTSLGDALKKTYARVDKTNKQIDLVASDVATNSENISSLQLTTEDISASVTQIETNTSESFDAVNEELSTLTSKVEAKMTAEDVKLEIQSELSNGVNKVTTSTGFTFNEQGLTVEKQDSEMKTTITENGMTVYKNDEAVLTANNIGVDAVNLHATTYLIIGNNSRFEDYQTNRTGCFYIGD